MRLLPREEKFYVFLLEQTDLLSRACSSFASAVPGGFPAMGQIGEELRQIRKRSQTLVAEVLSGLNATFITPLDPEDIHSLSVHLHSVISKLEETTQRFFLYRVEGVPPGMPELGSAVERSAGQVRDAFNALSKSERVLPYVIDLTATTEKRSIACWSKR
jgi:uncharacterized protein Yka (UPF0111/DUF47 family)